MPKFVIERDIPGAGNLSDAELQEISRKSVTVLKGMETLAIIRPNCNCDSRGGSGGEHFSLVRSWNIHPSQYD